MNILILNPSSIHSSNVVRDVIYGCWCKGKRIGGGTVLPYWLIHIATILKNSDFDVTYRDMQVSSKIIPEDHNAVVINTSSMSFNEDVKLFKDFKEKNPNIKTIFFGSHATYMPQYCLKKNEVDFVVRGEPDYILRDLLIAIRENREYEDVPGIGFRKNGKTILNQPCPYIENLDELPFLDDSFIPDMIYFNPLIRKYPYISLITSRGCPGECVFCPAASFYGNKYRWQTPQRIVSEIEYFYKKGYQEIYFRDETFTFNKKRLKEICELLIKKNIKISWICNARISTLNYDLIKLMKSSGCHYIKFGIESGSQNILNAIKKGISIESVRQTFSWTNKIGIDTHAHFMIGMPGETKNTVEDTIQFAKKIKPTTATFGICTPYPGTPLFDKVAKEHPEIKDGSHADFSSLHVQGVFNEEFTSLVKDDLKKGVYKAYRKFYIRPLYIISWLCKIRNWTDIRRISIAGAQVIDFIFRGD